MKVKSLKKKMTAFVLMVSIAVISIAAAVTGCGRDENDAGDDSHAQTENAGRNEASGPNDGNHRISARWIQPSWRFTLAITEPRIRFNWKIMIPQEP